MIVKRENRSKSNPSAKPYVTQLDTETGQSSCTCPGWINLRAGKPRGCRHTKALEAELGVVGEVEQALSPLATSDGAAARASLQRMTEAVANGDHPLTARRRVQREEREQKVAALPVEPMLASAMTRGVTLERFVGDPEWLLEEKYDGIRILVEKRTREGGYPEVRAYSRAGNARTLPGGIARAVEQMPDGVYDGELVVPGGMSSDVARLELQRQQVLVLFDVVRLFGQSTTSQTYDERRDLLRVAVAHVAAWDPSCATVAMSASMPVTREMVEAIWARGGEGAILKRRRARYQPGYRSADWVKVKKEIAVVVTVLGFEAGDTGIAFGKTRVKGPGGREFHVKTLDNETIRQVSADPDAFAGRRLVVKCNEVLPSGALRHPMWDHWAGDGE